MKVMGMLFLAFGLGACGTMQARSPAVSILVDLDPASTAYISNYDVPLRDNLDANGTTARDGIGASTAQITP